MNKLQTLDYVAIVLYMVMMSGIGIFLGRFVKNINDYFKGGNGVSWIAGGISNFMTKFSTFIFVAYAGIAYSDGLVAITVIWSTVFPSLIAIFFFAKRWKRAGIMSPVEFLETRYNAPMRQIFSWSGVVFKLLDDMIKLYSIGLFITAASGLPFEYAVVGCGVVVTIYTVVGGFWAVIVTDVVQFVILFFATLILVPLAYNAAGGIENMQAVIPKNMTWFNGKKGMPLWLMTYYILLIIRYLGNWTFIQRFYSAKTETDGQKLAGLSALFFFIFPIIFLFPPLAARVILPDLANPEMAYVSLCVKLLPSGIMGLMMAAMFAATMSVLSAEFNVTASVLTRDIYQRVFRPNASGKESLLVGRLLTLLVGTIVTIGALFVAGFGGAFEANKLLAGIFAVPMIIPVIVGVLMAKPQPWGALVTLLGGVILGFLMHLFFVKNDYFNIAGTGTIEEIRWAIATLVEIVFCFAVFIISGYFPSNDSAYNQRVSAFFHKLTIPFVPLKDSQNDGAFADAIKLMYGIAFALTGSMFVIMGFPSRSLLSGQLALGAGFLCICIAAFLYFRKNKKIIIMNNVTNKVVFITGASSGIGKATALMLLDEGAKVFDFSRTNQLSDEISHPNLQSFKGDVSVETDVIAGFAACIETFGTVDALLNNAGLGLVSPDLSTTDLATFEDMMNVNVKGVFLCNREALKVMKARKSGHILTVISMAGQRTNPNAPLYCASKFGARGLNSGLADQALKLGIKVTDINPGPTDSNYWGDRQVPREKFLKVEDVARVIVFVVNQPEYVLIREINFDNMKFLA